MYLIKSNIKYYKYVYCACVLALMSVYALPFTLANKILHIGCKTIISFVSSVSKEKAVCPPPIVKSCWLWVYVKICLEENAMNLCRLQAER